MNDVITTIASIASVVGALVAILISLRKAPAEVRLTDADAAGKISQAAAVLVEPLQKRLEVVEAELEESCAQIDALEKQAKALKVKQENDAKRIAELEALGQRLQTENDLLRDWAGRLVAQLQSHNIDPESFEKSPTKPTAKKSGKFGEWPTK